MCLALARAAGIRYEVQHNHTSVDAPETVYHVRETFHRLENKSIKCTVNLPMFKGARVTMWSLIPQKLMPPTRVVRYCCSVLKEQGGKGRMITTGVRWAESAKRRKNRGIYEKQSADISRRITISNDNDDTRRLFENCRLQAKRICNPIVDWTDREVWTTFVPSISRSIRCTSAAFIVSAVSVVRWRAVPDGSLSLVGIQPMSGRTCTHLNGCLRNAVAGTCLPSGRAGKKCCTGGCRTACCRGS